MLYKQLILSPENFIAILKDQYVLKSIMFTLYSSFLATILAILLGVPLAYVIARNEFYGKNLIESIIDIPVIIPHTVAGIALFSLLSRRSTLGTVFGNLGIVFQDSLWGVVIAMFLSAIHCLLIQQKRDLKVLIQTMNELLEL